MVSFAGMVLAVPRVVEILHTLETGTTLSSVSVFIETHKGLLF
jgi:hypothetical protein